MSKLLTGGVYTVYVCNNKNRFLPLLAGCCAFLLSRRGAMKLSATVFRLSCLGFSGLVLFSRRVIVRGSFVIEINH